MFRIFWTSVFACLTFALAATPAFSSAYIAVDLKTGRVVDHKDANRPWHPASLTKLMTAYVTFEAIARGALTLESPVVQSANSIKEQPSKMGFKVGTSMSVDNALKMVIVKSANDIAVALGEAVAGSEAEFVKRMNATAKRIGMNRTNFMNPNGLHHPQMVTTARDMAVLAQSIFTNFPQHAHYFKIPAIRHGKTVMRAHNLLLERYRGTTGLKTGYVCASGFNLAASAERNGRHYVAIVLGGASSYQRAETAARLLNDGFTGKRRGGHLDRVSSGRNYTSAPDLRSSICGAAARTARAKEREARAAKRPLTEKQYRTLLTSAYAADESVKSSFRGVELYTSDSLLGPRQPTMDPVRVRTGTAANTKWKIARIKLPVPRPYIEKVASSAREQETASIRVPMPRPATN